MRVLITGAAGFIGSALVDALTARGHDVHAAVRQAESRRDIDSATFVETDLSAPGAARALADIDADAAVHLAWYAEAGSYLHAVEENLASLEFSIALLRALRESRCGRVVLAGTGLEAISEGAGASVYAATKRALHAASDRIGISVACAHIHHLYGPGEDARRVVPTTIGALLDDRPIELTDCAHLRHSLHVSDAANALSCILESEAEGRIDVVAGEPTTLRHVLETAGELTRRTHNLVFGAREAGSDEVDIVGDPAMLEGLGFRPALTLREGIAQTIEWWRSARPGRELDGHDLTREAERS